MVVSLAEDVRNKYSRKRGSCAPSYGGRSRHHMRSTAEKVYMSATHQRDLLLFTQANEQFQCRWKMVFPRVYSAVNLSQNKQTKHTKLKRRRVWMNSLSALPVNKGRSLCTPHTWFYTSKSGFDSMYSEPYPSSTSCVAPYRIILFPWCF